MSPHELHARHERLFESNRFVYPVLSRRSGGISIGVNLTPDKVCNFNCIYCQVDRAERSETRFVEIETLADELDRMFSLVVSGELFRHEKFRNVAAADRVLRDVAFSGDGEPTIYSNVGRVIAECAKIKRRHGLGELKMVLMTNASLLDRDYVTRALETLDANRGEIWAKLDAGTELYFQRVARTAVPYQRIIDNITAAARVRPLVIQSLWMRIDGAPPSPTELDAYCDRLGRIVADGGQIRLVQIYTVARRPAEQSVTPLSNESVDALVDLVRRRTQLAVSGYYGVSDPS